MEKTIGVLLSGCGVYDGAEIHESVACLFALKKHGLNYKCFAPNKEQHHVINHLTGEELPEKRNVLVESARIARGEVLPLSEFPQSGLDGLLIPGGFGAAKNLSTWAFKGPDAELDSEVKAAILTMLDNKKPVGAVCMGPTLIALACKGTVYSPRLTVGSISSSSPYDIQAISDGMAGIGSIPEMKNIDEVSIDATLKIVTGACYMMDTDIQGVFSNVEKVVDSLKKFLH
jgi:enhancing lycopene biosynthesis protein 2